MAKDLVRTRRYVSKFYQMRTQLQAVSLRLQTLRSNEQMAVAMKGATKVSASYKQAIPFSDLPFLCIGDVEYVKDDEPPANKQDPPGL